MVEFYEAVGKLIYGVQRLDGVLETLNVWLGSQVAKNLDVAADVKYADRAAVAAAYFAAHPQHDGVRDVYLEVLRTVRDLDQQCGLLKSEKFEVSPFLIQLRESHFALADVIDKLASPGMNADWLRSHGSR
ncbi:MAG: hypothetical protein V4857_26895 [Pseudomonadota bacterium]